MRFATGMMALLMASAGFVVGCSGGSAETAPHPEQPPATADARKVRGASRVPRESLPEHAVARLGSLRLVPDSSTVNGLAFSPDGRLLATLVSARFGSVLPGVQIWDAATGREAVRLPIAERNTNGIAWAPDSTRLATCHPYNEQGASVEIWNIRTRQRERTLIRADEAFSCVAWSPDGAYVAAGQMDGTLRVWDARSGRMLHDLRVPAASVAFSRDGTRLAAGNSEALVLWSMEDWSEVQRIEGTWHFYNPPCLSPDGTLAALCSGDGLRLVDLETGEWSEPFPETLRQNRATDPAPSSAAPQEDQAGTDESEGPAVEVPAQRKPYKLSTADLTFSPDGRLIAGAGFNGSVYVWDVAERREVQRFRNTQFAVAFSPDGKRLAFPRRRIMLVDPRTGEDHTPTQGHSAGVLSALFTRDGDTVLSGDLDGTIRSWDWRTGDQRSVWRPRSGGASILALSRDGETLAAAGGVPRIITLLDPATGDEQAVLEGLDASVTALDFSPVADTLASADTNGALTVWDVATGRKELEIPAAPVFDEFAVKGICTVRFSPDGTLLARSNPGAGGIDIFDTASGARKQRVGTINAIFLPFAFVPGRQAIAGLAAGSRTSGVHIMQRVRWWDLQTGFMVAQAERDSDMITALAGSPDGRLVASGEREQSGDVCVVSVWSAASGELLLTLNGHINWIRALAFSRDGKHLLSASEDTTVLVWDVAAAYAALPGDNERR